MTNAQAIFLGLVQGLTEYVPVSSSAHLVLVPRLLGWEFLPKESFVFDVLVQLGTLVGIFAYFWVPIGEISKSLLQGVAKRDFFHDENCRLVWLVVLASIPAALLGLLFKNEIASFFSSPAAACYCLILTGILLIAAEWFGRVLKSSPSRSDAMFIGMAQSLALLPGISRSGATISAGLACGLSRQDAARFSFLMSIPVMVGASLVASLELINDIALVKSLMLPLLLGFLSAAMSGYLVISWFMRFLSTRRLIWFALYCLSIGIFGVAYLG